jgi:hypothetical protein
MATLSTNWKADLIHHIENSHRYGIGQLSTVIFETLLVAEWTPETIELVADELRSRASDQIKYRRIKT